MAERLHERLVGDAEVLIATPGHDQRAFAGQASSQHSGKEAIQKGVAHGLGGGAIDHLGSGSPDLDAVVNDHVRVGGHVSQPTGVPVPGDHENLPINLDPKEH